MWKSNLIRTFTHVPKSFPIYDPVLEMPFLALIVVFKRDSLWDIAPAMSAERPLLAKHSFQLAAVFQPCIASETQVLVCSGEGSMQFPSFLLFWVLVHRSVIRTWTSRKFFFFLRERFWKLVLRQILSLFRLCGFNQLQSLDVTAVEEALEWFGEPF